MSLVTLSMTAATYLFFQHEEYISYDIRMKRRTRGVNDAKLIYIVFCTLLYVMVNAPRIWANALILAISPMLGVIMLLIEFLVNLWISHNYVLNLRHNAL